MANTVSRPPHRKATLPKKDVSEGHGFSHAVSSLKKTPASAAEVNHDGSKPYTSAEIDFFAFYIIPEDLWYIVPIADVTRARYAVYLNPHERGNKYFRFMEAWHLLRPHAKK